MSDAKAKYVGLGGERPDRYRKQSTKMLPHNGMMGWGIGECIFYCKSCYFFYLIQRWYRGTAHIDLPWAIHIFTGTKVKFVGFSKLTLDMFLFLLGSTSPTSLACSRCSSIINMVEGCKYRALMLYDDNKSSKKVCFLKWFSFKFKTGIEIFKASFIEKSKI